MKSVSQATSTAKTNKVDLEKIAAGVKLILEGIGDDPARQELLQTPHLVAEMYRELFSGIGIDPGLELEHTFKEQCEGLILLKDIPFVSFCEHHLVPFIGLAHVGYIPNEGQIAGLSKLARVVELAARRLQLQERMTNQIADALTVKLKPSGVIVVLEAEHFCVSIRGIKKPGTKMVTSAMRGILQTDSAKRAEAITSIYGQLTSECKTNNFHDS